MAQNGFIVLAIEYRGGSGHGREFQLLALGEYGAGQGWDAVGAARYLAGLPYPMARSACTAAATEHA